MLDWLLTPCLRPPPPPLPLSLSRFSLFLAAKKTKARWFKRGHCAGLASDAPKKQLVKGWKRSPYLPDNICVHLANDDPVIRLKEIGVEKRSGRDSTLQGRARSVFNQANTGTVSRATLRRLLRDGAERVWANPSATMRS